MKHCKTSGLLGFYVKYFLLLGHFSNFKNPVVMKNFTILFFAFFFSFSAVDAQSNWFSEGATWTYHLTGTWSSYDTTSVTKVVGDTIIAGQEAKIVSVNFPTSEYQSLMYERNDSVFQKDFSGDTWRLVYDFSASVGDSILWSYYYEGLVDEVGTIQFGNHERKYLSVLKASNWGDYKDYFVEGIGKIGNSIDSLWGCGHIVPFFWECESAVDGPNFRFQCYSSPGLNYDPFEICMLTDTEEINAAAQIAVYPNPATDFLQFKNYAAVERLEVFDISGKMRMQIDNVTEKIDVSNWASGIYFLRFTGEDGRGVSRRVVIQKP